MNDNEIIANSKKRWVALLLNILFLGVGYAYIGKFNRFFLLVLSYYFILIAVYLDDYFYYASIVAIAVFILFYIYSFFDIYHSFPVISNKNIRFSKWYCLVICFIFPLILFGTNTFGFLNLLPVKSFVVPSISMENTIKKGDFIFAKKNSKIKRGDVVVFKSPLDNKTYFDKRVVAVGGDEVVYQDNKLYIHFNESNDDIKKSFANAEMKVINGKFWVLNPYKSLHNGINYTKNEMNLSIFEILLQYFNFNKNIDMKPMYIKDFGGQAYDINKTIVNILYKKISPNHYYMIGDNRNNSNDSRFWGEVPRENIYGIVTKVYFNPNDLSRIGKKVE